jgi:cyanate permease
VSALDEILDFACVVWHFFCLLPTVAWLWQARQKTARHYFVTTFHENIYQIVCNGNKDIN